MKDNWISDAARAAEMFGEDELERFAEELAADRAGVVPETPPGTQMVVHGEPYAGPVVSESGQTIADLGSDADERAFRDGGAAIYEVTIINGAAQTAAYEADRRPEPGEAQRKLELSAPTISHLNGIVQQRMMAEGFERNEWKILGHKVLREVL